MSTLNQIIGELRSFTEDNNFVFPKPETMLKIDKDSIVYLWDKLPPLKFANLMKHYSFHHALKNAKVAELPKTFNNFEVKVIDENLQDNIQERNRGNISPNLFIYHNYQGYVLQYHLSDFIYIKNLLHGTIYKIKLNLKSELDLYLYRELEAKNRKAGCDLFTKDILGVICIQDPCVNLLENKINELKLDVYGNSKK